MGENSGNDQRRVSARASNNRQLARRIDTEEPRDKNTKPTNQKRGKMRRRAREKRALTRGDNEADEA